MDCGSWSLGLFSKTHLLEVGRTQNQETMALWTLVTVDLFYFYHVWWPAWIGIAFGWGSGHIWLHTTLEGPWPHHMILEVCWDNLWTLCFGLSQFHGHGSWLVCEVYPRPLIAWKLGLTTCTRGPKFEVPSTTWMPTWQHFSEVRGLGLVLKVGSGKKLGPSSQHKSYGHMK